MPFSSVPCQTVRYYRTFFPFSLFAVGVFIWKANFSMTSCLSLNSEQLSISLNGIKSEFWKLNYVKFNLVLWITQSIDGDRYSICLWVFNFGTTIWKLRSSKCNSPSNIFFNIFPTLLLVYEQKACKACLAKRKSEATIEGQLHHSVHFAFIMFLFVVRFAREHLTQLAHRNLTLTYLSIRRIYTLWNLTHVAIITRIHGRVLQRGM